MAQNEPLRVEIVGLDDLREIVAEFRKATLDFRDAARETYRAAETVRRANTPSRSILDRTTR